MLKKQKLILIFSLLAVIFSLTGCQLLTQSSLTVAGSTALQPIIEAAANKYRQKNPHFYINVQGGGSGAGLSQVAEGTIDLGTSDVFAAQKPGINRRKLQDYKIAVVGITLIINKKAGINHLSSRQLAAIFSGQIRNWKKVGGNNLPITVINRTSGSGTRLNFEKFVLNNKSSLTAQEQSSSATAYKIVKDTPGAISYVAFPSAKAGVVKPKINGITPTDENVRQNRWKIWAYEHVYLQKKASVNAQKFLAYLKSAEVEKIIERLGFITISSMHVSRNQNGQIRHVN